MEVGKSDLNSPGDFVHAGKFECATAQIAGDNFNGAWSFADYDVIWMPFAVMGGMTFLTMIALLIILKRRDPV